MFIRRYTSDPGIEVLLEIESVNILDIEPSAPLTSVGSGTVMLVGEFEKGPYNEPTEVFGVTDIASTFGGFGYSYAGVVANNPCARSRNADAAVAAEYWNGNGMVALNGKKFSRLVIVRVDTSVGSVEFTRLASLLGNVQSTFALTTGQHVDMDIGGGPVVATFTGTPGIMTGIAFPGGGGLTGFVGGEWIEFCYDDATLAVNMKRVYFLAADQTPAQVAARINLYFGFTFCATILAGTGIELTGRQGGTGGRVDIVNANVAGTTVAVGLPQTATKGSETSNAVFPVALAPTDTFTGTVDGGAPATLTIAATNATIAGAGAGYAAGHPGDTVLLTINGFPPQIIDLGTVGAGQPAYIIAINAQLVGGHCEDNGAGQLRLVTDQKGSGAGGNITGFTGSAAADTGFGIAPFVNAGPNNVINVLSVTAAEMAGLLTATFVGGVAGSLGVAVGTTQVRWETNTGGIAPNGVQFTGGTGVAKVAGWDLAAHNGTAAIPATASGAGNVVNIAAVTVAEAHTIIHLASASVSVDVGAGGAIRISNTGTPATGTLHLEVTTTATAFGWPLLPTTATAVTGTAGTIPAGTRVRNVGAVEWVTCEDVTVTAASAGPYSVKVRHANDDGTGVAALTGTVTTVFDAIEIDNFSVSNPQPLSVALTENQLDTAYLTAFDATVDVNTVAHDVNTAYSARQSNAVRRKGRDNAQDASANGCYGRRFCMRPPFGTTRTVAKQATEPGIGAYRHERVIYCYPGASVYMPAIATRGVGGGVGFTADGFIDEGADGFMAMLCSLLPPEENPGQITDYLNAVSGLESSTNTLNWTIDDYTSFKANGIAALRMDAGTPEFQSGVTAVDPVAHPGQTRISRRRLADVLQDTMALRAKTYGKKLGTRARWSAMLGVFTDYLAGMQKAGRIEAFKVDGQKGNTAASWALGVRWVIAYVQTIASMDSIVLQAEIGESVDVTAV